jgi:hypothetical protein
VDYTAAFLHAPIKEDVYIDMSRTFLQPGKVLKLNHCLYGLKQSPRNFFLHLKEQLGKVGLEPCDNVDPCLFVSDKVICLVYVDDTLFFSPKQEYINEVVEGLHPNLEEEDDVSGFLGVLVKHNSADGSVTLTQEGLSKRIVETKNLGSHAKTSAIPNQSLPSHEQNGDHPSRTVQLSQRHRDATVPGQSHLA